MRTFIWLLLAVATFSSAIAAGDANATRETKERPPAEEPRQYQLAPGDTKTIRDSKEASFNAFFRFERQREAVRAALADPFNSSHRRELEAILNADLNRYKLVDDLLWAKVKAAALQAEIWRLEADLAAIEYQRARDKNKASQDGNPRDAVSDETIERLRLRAESARFRADTGEDIDNVPPAATQ